MGSGGLISDTTSVRILLVLGCLIMLMIIICNTFWSCIYDIAIDPLFSLIQDIEYW